MKRGSKIIVFAIVLMAVCGGSANAQIMYHQCGLTGSRASPIVQQLNYMKNRVKITGWMLFDFEHIDESENTAPGKRDNWRATAWKVHPVTDITLLDR